MKKRSMGKIIAAFVLACILTLITGYNRIHMTNHFLSDVCFCCLITYLIFSAVCMVFLQTMRKHSSKNDKAD